MPGAHGGDQLDEEYAPHLHIGGEFVGKTEQIRAGRWTYRAGWSGSKLLVERVRNKNPPLTTPKHELVPPDKIPVKVLKQMQNKAPKSVTVTP